MNKANLLGGSKGAGTDPLGQHDEASAESSAGRSASYTNEHYSSAVTNMASSRREKMSGGDRRVARYQPRDKRVTVRFSDQESAQLTRVADRFRLSESGVIRAAVDYLDGAPAPRAVNVDVLRLIAAVNAVGVNVNQLARQGWAGTAPSVKDLSEVTSVLLALVKELS